LGEGEPPAGTDPRATIAVISPSPEGAEREVADRQAELDAIAATQPIRRALSTTVFYYIGSISITFLSNCPNVSDSFHFKIKEQQSLTEVLLRDP
jgi:hypothetical protein